MTTPADHNTSNDRSKGEPWAVPLTALRLSAHRLSGLTTDLTDEQLTSPAYATGWTVAQVLSHLGSGAVIMQRRLEDSLAGQETPDEFSPGVWDTWNLKSPAGQRSDALEADAALLERIDALTPEQREAFSFAMGPMSFDLGGFIGLRLNEHALHTWDIEVAADPAATIPTPLAEVVVDNLDLIARFTAKPTGDTATMTVATKGPSRGFTIDLRPSGVALTANAVPSSPDVELPAEAFVRLVYGRLDTEHTPPGGHGLGLRTLRRVFPGP